MNTPLAEMLKYDRWATLTLLDACESIDVDVLGTTPPGISGSIQELLVHIVGAQETFAARANGRASVTAMGRDSGWPGFAALRSLSSRAGDELVSTALALETDRDVQLDYAGKTYRFPARFFLTHAMEHGAEHRTEVKVGLAQLGIATPDLDGWSYAAAAGYGLEVS